MALPHIPSEVTQIQKQIQRLFQNVLDIKFGKASPVPKLMAGYYDQEDSDTLDTFQFQKLPPKFEAVDSHTFTEVLYPNSIYDLIDYFLRQCVQREQRMRVCKNCGLYFAVKGRVCKEIGALCLG